jgi:membrane-associated phospholipid phosphatase
MKKSIQFHWSYFIGYLIFIAVSGIVLLNFPKQDIHIYLNNFHYSFADTFFKYITYVGDGAMIAVVVVILAFISKRKALFIMLSGVISGAIAQLLKKVVFGPTARPSAYFNDLEIPLYYVDGVELHAAFSFPSGHSTAIFALVTAILLIQKSKKFDILLILTAILVGYSRIYLSQHFLIDVFTGSIIGTSITLIVYQFLYSPKMLTKNGLDKPLINLRTK